MLCVIARALLPALLLRKRRPGDAADVVMGDDGDGGWDEGWDGEAGGARWGGFAVIVDGVGNVIMVVLSHICARSGCSKHDSTVGRIRNRNHWVGCSNAPCSHVHRLPKF